MRTRLWTLAGGFALLFAIQTTLEAPAHADACITACKKKFRGFWKTAPRLACMAGCRIKRSKLGRFLKKAGQALKRGARRAWTKLKRSKLGKAFKKAGQAIKRGARRAWTKLKRSKLGRFVKKVAKHVGKAARNVWTGLKRLVTRKPAQDLSQLHLAAPRPTVGTDDLASLSSAVYSAGNADILARWIPKGYRIIDRLVAQKGMPLQAMALEHEPSGKVVIALRGTQFSDPLDLFADLGIGAKAVGTLVSTVLGAIRGMFKSLAKKVGRSFREVGAATKRFAGKVKATFRRAWDWVKRKTKRFRESKVGRFLGKVARGVGKAFKKVGKAVGSVARKAKEKLDALLTRIAMKLGMNRGLKAKLDASRAYVQRVLRQVKKRAGAPIVRADLIVTGHSLGGYLAQVVAAENGLAAHTFNAPGAQAELPQARGEGIVNHTREHDLVGRIGRHIGATRIYQDVEYLLADITKRYLVRNHGIDDFFYGLRRGVVGRLLDRVKRILGKPPARPQPREARPAGES